MRKEIDKNEVCGFETIVKRLRMHSKQQHDGMNR